MLQKYLTPFIFLFFLGTFTGFSQEISLKEKQRIEKLSSELGALQKTIIGLTKTVDFNASDMELPVFVRAVGKARKVNLSISPQLEHIRLTHNFSNAQVKDVLLYLCKEYKLTFEVTGNIIALKKVIPQKEKKKPYVSRSIPVNYDANSDLFSIDLQNDSLAIAFKKITNITNKNLVFAPGLGNKKISGYIQNKSFESAMDKLAFSNNLIVTKTKDNYYLFESNYTSGQASPAGVNNGAKPQTRRPNRYRNANFFFKVIDIDRQVLEVDFENVEIAAIIKDIGGELNIDMFTNAALDNIGTASVKAKEIKFNQLLTEILKDTKFTYKKKNDIYYFGKEEQASLRSAVVIPLMHRSIEIMDKPMQSNRNNFNSNLGSIGGNYNTNYGSGTNDYNSNSNRNLGNNQRNNSFNNQRRIDTQSNQSFGSYSSKSEALVNILPKDVVADLEIKTDIEHNTFIVSGDAQKIERFKEFVAKIDKPVPVVLIEVMILEVSKTATVSSGIELGLGEEPTADSGNLFPEANVTLGATTINKVIGGFNGFGSLNVGKVVPNFFAKIQLLEGNGHVKIRSTPKLSTLNGHSASLSNGERSYYKITRTDVIGSQTSQTIQTNNYAPIDADLSINIRPIVSGDQQITLSVNVNQSSFNGERIDADAPPGMNSREFTSTIRVEDQDVVILGGLEENVKNDSGSGVPFLARIPIIKWFFSKKTRTDSKTKLSVLIRPTIIR